MDANKSLEIIQSMMKASQRSLYRNSPYFILWGALIGIGGILETLLAGYTNAWLIWPVIGILGGILSAIYDKKEKSQAGHTTAGDRITNYTWMAFGLAAIPAIAISVFHEIPPHPYILLLAGAASFVTGGISRFNPFIAGALLMIAGAIILTFVVPPSYWGAGFGLFIFAGYLIPGLILRKKEHDETE